MTVEVIRARIELDGVDRPGSVFGHRFGRWLEVFPEPAARQALETACFLEQTGDAEEAIEVLVAALEDNQTSASLFEARGAIYLSLGYPRAAVGDFQRAVALDSKDARAWYALGHSYEMLDLSRQALDALERARGLGARDPGLLLSLARVYRSLERIGQAAGHYEQALRLLDEPLVERERAEVELESISMSIQDVPSAERVLNVCERLDSCRNRPLSDDAWLLRSLLREMCREPSRDVPSTLRALEVAPAELEALASSLLVAVRLTDSETGAATHRELLEAEPDPRRKALLERCLDRE